MTHNTRTLTMGFSEFCSDAAGGISEEYGYRYLRKYKDKLPPVLRLPGHGRKIFFRRVDVDSWLAGLANAQPTKRRRGRPTKASKAILRRSQVADSADLDSGKTTDPQAESSK
ncbi:MAG TPA: hypothetical protein VGM16_12605 [Gammaproteobacteria bacterium]|jgi:hypothetical protein